jgi:DNA-binding NarL/FixJ family response regulator
MSEPGVGPTGITVVVADDHPMFRAGIAALVDSLPWATVAAEAGDGDAAVAAALQHRPDVLLVDLHMPGRNGLEVIRELAAAAPQVRCLVLTMVENDVTAAAALRAGARGYLLKGASRDEVTRALRAVANDEVILGPSVGPAVVARLAAGEDRLVPFPQLSPREREVLEQVARGLTNTQVGLRLHLSEKTVRNLVSAVLAKLPATTRAEAIARARDAGLGADGTAGW